MRLVNDDDLVAVSRRGVADGLPQLAYRINAPVGGGVNFDHIHGASRRDFLAGIAFTTRLRRRASVAVQSLGQQPRDRGFPDAALAGKDVAVSDAVQADGILESDSDVPLTDDLSKALWAPRSCNDLIQGNDHLGLGFPAASIKTRGQLDLVRVYLARLRDILWHTEAPATVASFRTWRDLQVSVAQSPKSDIPRSGTRSMVTPLCQWWQ